jgi:hypothetical protein
MDFTPITLIRQTPAQCNISRARFTVTLEKTLATFYAQSRLVMLPRRCLTATAGTSLVRGSYYLTQLVGNVNNITKMLVQAAAH